jgi:hypothetical protein
MNVAVLPEATWGKSDGVKPVIAGSGGVTVTENGTFRVTWGLPYLIGIVALNTPVLADWAHDEESIDTVMVHPIEFANPDCGAPSSR